MSSGNREEKAVEIFVGGFAPSVTREEINDYFSQYGALKSCRIVYDPETKASRGFAFLKFSKKSSCDAVLSQAHIFKGNEIECKQAASKSESKKAFKEEKKRKIFVGALHPKATDRDLRDFFQQFGSLISAKVIRSADPKKNRGFGFVIFESTDVLEYVLSLRGNLKLFGRTLDCKRIDSDFEDSGNFQNNLPDNEVSQEDESFQKLSHANKGISIRNGHQKSKGEKPEEENSLQMGLGSLKASNKYVQKKPVAPENRYDEIGNRQYDYDEDEDHQYYIDTRGGDKAQANTPPHMNFNAPAALEDKQNVGGLMEKEKEELYPQEWLDYYEEGQSEEIQQPSEPLYDDYQPLKHHSEHSFYHEQPYQRQPYEAYPYQGQHPPFEQHRQYHEHPRHPGPYQYQPCHPYQQYGDHHQAHLQAHLQPYRPYQQYQEKQAFPRPQANFQNSPYYSHSLPLSAFSNPGHPQDFLQGPYQQILPRDSLSMQATKEYLFQKKKDLTNMVAKDSLYAQRFYPGVPHQPQANSVYFRPVASKFPQRNTKDGGPGSQHI